MLNLSYGEIAALEFEFNNQCKKMGIRWVDEDVKMEALNQFIADYEDGDADPQVMLLGYGYLDDNI